MQLVAYKPYMSRFLGLLQFVVLNFGPLLVFYGLNRGYGIRAAVVGSVLCVLAEWFWHRWHRRSVSQFFKLTAVMIVIFGAADFYIQKGVFFRFEAAMTNFIVGIYFAFSLRGPKPIIQEFAEAQGRVSGSVSPDTVRLFRFLTVIWSIYQFAKSGFYVWVGMNYDLEQGLALRSVVGSVSFYALLFVSVFGARTIKRMLHDRV